MLKVGLTGGIGAGKSTVAKIFEKLGVPVYYADDNAKKLMVTDAALIEGVKAEFGKDVYLGDELDRARLARIVFNNQGKLEKLNKLVHPAVRKDFTAWCLRHKTQPYVVEEAAILFESGAYKLMDKIVMVTAPRDMRIERVMKRDGVTKEAVQARMANQWPEEEKISLSDFVIMNDNEKLVIPQVLNVHNVMSGKA